MKRLTLITLITVAVTTVFFSGCTLTKHAMREPNTRVEFNKSDFELSEQVTANASTTKIFCIDWERLFYKETGTIDGTHQLITLANIPVVGNVVSDNTANYALYELMKKYKGYDVVFYPQYETYIEKPIGLGFIYKKINVTTTARLGKLKQ